MYIHISIHIYICTNRTYGAPGQREPNVPAVPALGGAALVRQPGAQSDPDLPRSRPSVWGGFPGKLQARTSQTMYIRVYIYIYVCV